MTNQLKEIVQKALKQLNKKGDESVSEISQYLANQSNALETLLHGLLNYINEKDKELTKQSIIADKEDTVELTEGGLAFLHKKELILNKSQVENIKNASKSFNSEQAKINEIDKLDITAKQARNKLLNVMLNSTKIKWQNNKNDIFTTINDAIKKGESKVTFNNDDHNWMNFEKFIERVRYELNKRGYITHIYQESFDPTHGLDKNTFLNEMRVSW